MKPRLSLPSLVLSLAMFASVPSTVFAQAQGKAVAKQERRSTEKRGREGRAGFSSLRQRTQATFGWIRKALLGKNEQSGARSVMRDRQVAQRPEREGEVMNRVSGLIDTLSQMDNNPQRKALLHDVARPRFDAKAVERTLAAHGEQSRSEAGALVYSTEALEPQRSGRSNAVEATGGERVGVKLHRMGPEGKRLRLTIFPSGGVGRMQLHAGKTQGARITVSMERDGTIHGVNTKGRAELVLKELANQLAEDVHEGKRTGSVVDPKDLMALTNYLAPKALEHMVVAHPHNVKGPFGEKTRELRGESASRQAN